jgi:hypothetical protein
MSDQMLVSFEWPFKNSKSYTGKPGRTRKTMFHDGFKKEKEIRSMLRPLLHILKK